MTHNWAHCKRPGSLLQWNKKKVINNFSCNVIENRVALMVHFINVLKIKKTYCIFYVDSEPEVCFFFGHTLVFEL